MQSFGNKQVDKDSLHLPCTIKIRVSDVFTVLLRSSTACINDRTIAPL